jgi:glycosyltransferase involved in cell wall biosynthesis
MNILMMTNTYLPFIGGVERSVELFAHEYKKFGHNVLIVAPTYENMQEPEFDIIRVPALQKFNGTDFSLQLPIPGVLNAALKEFKPDIVHSHHPFMIGDSALRVAAQFKIPIVYTFHTYYESYTHYVPGDSPALKRFVTALVTGYANLCDYVFAPSTGVALELKKRGVETLIDVVPTGIELDKFSKGNGELFRRKLGIDDNAFVLGFVSRIAPEKNISFLANVICKFMNKNPTVHFLMAGIGPSTVDICKIFEHESLVNRFHYLGLITGQELIDAYHSMNVFVFASKTETQGLVVTEAMAAGLPVVAVNGSGITDVVQDFYNGRLLGDENEESYLASLEWCIRLKDRQIKKLQQHATITAASFAKEKCAEKALSIYSALLSKEYFDKNHSDSAWAKAVRMVKAELDLLKNVTKATGAAIIDEK